MEEKQWCITIVSIKSHVQSSMCCTLVLWSLRRILRDTLVLTCKQPYSVTGPNSFLDPKTPARLEILHLLSSTQKQFDTTKLDVCIVLLYTSHSVECCLCTCVNESTLLLLFSTPKREFLLICWEASESIARGGLRGPKCLLKCN